MTGWAKAWRSIVEHPVLYGHGVRKALFVDLILTAAREPCHVWYKSQYIELDVGEVCVSERDLAERYGVGRQQIRTILRVLKSTHMLTQRLTQHPTQHVRVIKLCNYAKYQGLSGSDNPADGPASNPPSNPALTQPQPREQEKEEETKDSMSPSETRDASGVVDQPDLDALLYRRGKALLGRNAGGQITKLRMALGSVGAALQVIDDARHKDSPAEYVAGCIRRNGHAAARRDRPSVIEAARRVAERANRLDEERSHQRGPGLATHGDDTS